MNEIVAQIRRTIREKIPSGTVVAEHTEFEHFYRHTPTNRLFASVTTKKSVIDEGGSRLKRWAANCAVEYLDKNWKSITPDNKDEHYKAAILAHEEKFTDAGAIGTQGHGVVEDYLKAWIDTGTRPDDIRTFIKGTDMRLWAITRSAEKFCIDFGGIPIASELKVASVKYGFAGTLDSLFLMPKLIRLGKNGCPHNWCRYDSPKKAMLEHCYHCDAKREWILTLVDWKTSNSIDKTAYVLQTSDYWQCLYEMSGLKCKEIIIVRLDKEKMQYEVLRVLDRAKAFKISRHVDKIYDYLYDGVSKLEPYKTKTIITI